MRHSPLVLLATADRDLAVESGLALRGARLGVAHTATVAETISRLADHHREPQVLLMDTGLADGKLLDALHAWVEVFGRSLPPTILWADAAAQETLYDHLGFLIDINAHRMELPLDTTALAGLAYQYARDRIAVPFWGEVLHDGAHCAVWRPRPWMLHFR